MINKISANELSEKREQGVWGITEGDIYLQKLREASEKQSLEEFCDICKEIYTAAVEIKNYVLANVPAILLNNYFNVVFSQKEYEDFTKKIDYWENKAIELRDFLARRQWGQFQSLVKKIICENVGEKMNILNFYEWLDKKGEYHYVEEYEREQNLNGILGKNGYEAFRDWLLGKGLGSLVYDYEQSKK